MKQVFLSRLGTCALGLMLTSAAFAAQDPRVQEHHRSMQAHAQAAGKAQPLVKEYRYGETLDIVNVVGVTDAAGSCELAPMAMTYQDGAGQLVTVLYTAMGTCPAN